MNLQADQLMKSMQEWMESNLTAKPEDMVISSNWGYMAGDKIGEGEFELGDGKVEWHAPTKNGKRIVVIFHFNGKAELVRTERRGGPKPRCLP